MIPELVSRSAEVDFMITPNPTQALILERQLIRQHKPRYNSLLKDDKSFPFIALSKHKFPRIMYTRHPPKGSDVWGPFANAGAAKQVIQLIRKNFPELETARNYFHKDACRCTLVYAVALASMELVTRTM